MLPKGVYPYKYMNYWEKLNETLPGNEDFYSQSIKYGRYYWCRLQECKNGF